MKRTGIMLALALLAPALSQLHAAEAKPPTSSCPLPPTDLCTDYVWRGHRWVSQPIPFYINNAAGLPGAEQDVLDAFLAWENEVKSARVESEYPGDGSSIAFAYGGPTSAGSSTDGRNVVFIGATRGGAAGASPRLRRNQILEFDISINTNYPWNTDVTCPLHDCDALDLQNAVTHEIGHALDLYHVSETAQAELTMAPGAARDETKKRDLGAGEVLALRRIYPSA